MPIIIFCVFIYSVAVQLFHFLFFFTRMLADPPKNAPSCKGVSVVVAAHNEEKNLQKLLPALLAQRYTDFEIIVANDRSTDGTKEVLEGYPSIKTITIDVVPEGLNPKKYALTQAIEAATKEIILLTDADCLPISTEWIAIMASNFTEGKELVLGYSPYEERKGFLNQLIRYETLYTAVQYFSFALAHMPYMGVGRNLAYTKTLFLNNNGFDKHKHITGGDDDLFINQTATHTNTAVELREESRVISYPKASYAEWIRQKTRHLSVGTQYSPKNKFLLGLFSTSLVLFYWSSFFLVVNNFLICFTITVFLLRTSVLICIFTLISKKLKDNFNPALFPILDFVYVINYTIIGIRAIRKKDNKWI